MSKIHSLGSEKLDDAYREYIQERRDHISGSNHVYEYMRHEGFVKIMDNLIQLMDTRILELQEKLRINKTEKELREIFNTKSDCYSAYLGQPKAMTEDAFVETIKSLTNF